MSDLPASAQRLADVARSHGWIVTVNRTTGTPIDKEGNPERVTERRPLVDVNTGQPLLTDAGRQRVEIVRTDEVKLVDSVAVRFTRDDVVLVGLWEDGSFRTGLRQSPFGRLGARELAGLVTS